MITLLVGCQSVPKLPLDTQNIELSDRQHWQLKARVALKSEQESYSATLDWHKQANNFDFHLYGLFGATYAQLIQENELATLKLPDDQVFYHQDAEQLLYQSLGWDFPVDALSYWVKGLPSGKTGEIVSRNEKGVLQNIVFQDWQVDFSRYQNFSGYLMPKRIVATHPKLSLKIILKQWQFNPTE